MTPEQTLDWLAQQHFDQCCEERPIQDWIRKMKSQLQEQPEQEPAAKYTGETWCGSVVNLYEDIPLDTLLYTTPPQRTWVGLTDKEAHELWESTDSDDDWELMKRTEAKLKEKNT